MPLAVGAEVVVTTLGNKRGVVVEAGHDGHYRVRVDSVTIACREGDLTMPAAGGAKRPRRPTRQERREASAETQIPPVRIDLHGLTVEDALARVVAAIDRTLLDGGDRLDILHGKSTGRVRDAVHRYLATLPVVASFALDPANTGVTVVRF